MLEVYSRLSWEDAISYDRFELALLKQYGFTEFGYRKRFCEAKSEGQESPGQFIVQLKNCFTKWVERSRVEKSFDGARAVY